MDTTGASQLGCRALEDVFLDQGSAYVYFHTPDKRTEAFCNSLRPPWRKQGSTASYPTELVSDYREDEQDQPLSCSQII